MAHRLHSLCRWTFNSGKGGFLPADARPRWSGDSLDSAGVVRLIAERIKPRLPSYIRLGYELHYDVEVHAANVRSVADALGETGIPLAMITPGAHSHFAYGGISSLDPAERAIAEKLGRETLEIAYGPLREVWDADVLPSLVIWNGSWGYDLASTGVQQMYRNLKESIANLCREEEKMGGALSIAIEPKPNEGHPALLLPTVASVLVFWHRLHSEYGISLQKKGLNKEIGHSEMIGLDPILDTVEEIDNDAVMHVHLNSQGYNDGLIHGGPGKYDIDHGVRINGFNLAMAKLLLDAGYARWYGHDMQVRPYDSEEQGIDRVVRSILSWDSCEFAAERMDSRELHRLLAARETAKAEDLVRDSVTEAYRRFDELRRM